MQICLHLTRTRTTTKCENAYSPEELEEFEENYQKNVKKLKRNYKKKNPEKVAQFNKTYSQKYFTEIAQYKKEWYRKKRENFGSQYLRFTRECNGPIYT